MVVRGRPAGTAWFRRADVRCPQGGRKAEEQRRGDRDAGRKGQNAKIERGSITMLSAGPASATRNDAPHRANSNPAPAPSDTSTTPSVSS